MSHQYHNRENSGRASGPTPSGGRRRADTEHTPIRDGYRSDHHPSVTDGQLVRHAALREGHQPKDLERRFWVSLVLTVPILVYSEEVQELLDFTAPVIRGSELIPLVLGSVVYFYGGSIFLEGARRELAARTPGMMTLISLAITVAYLYSLATEFVITGSPLYWELATLVVVMLLGHWIELRAVGRAQGALAELARLLPDTAELLTDERVETVPIQLLEVGDRILIRPGAKIPADGVVIEGRSSVNEAMVTGESRPVDKRKADNVIAGTVNLNGSLRAEVTRIGSDTTLASIMRLVEQAQLSRSSSQALADRAAYWLTLIAIGAGTITLACWLLLGAPAGFALERTVTVLVTACPHALGLAIPLVVAISTTLAARNGLLVRERLALEQARDLHVVVFDKTGTLTRGEHGVVEVLTTDVLPVNEVLALAAAAEGDSEHIIARAIRREAQRRGLKSLSTTSFHALPGRGVEAQVDGNTVLVGGSRILERSSTASSPDLSAVINAWAEDGKTAVYVLVNGQLKGMIALADVIRDESRDAVARLRGLGVRVAMLTGDSEAVARWVARDLGIDEYFAEVLPEQKAERIRDLRHGGQKVAMVGDGVNDAPALLTADVGIAIGAGTDVAIESAGIILVRNDPRDVVRVVELSRASYRKMLQNLAWATGYNAFAIPLAAGALAPLGIFLVPAVGALLMSASTVIVALNAQMLRRLDLRRL